MSLGLSPVLILVIKVLSCKIVFCVIVYYMFIFVQKSCTINDNKLYSLYKYLNGKCDVNLLFAKSSSQEEYEV